MAHQVGLEAVAQAEPVVRLLMEIPAQLEVLA
jgi:hypothetical protein